MSATSDSCEGRVCCLEARVGGGCHMTRRGWDSQFCWGCIRHEFARAGLHNNEDKFVLVFIVLLVYSWRMKFRSSWRSAFCITTNYEELQVAGTSWRVVMWKGGYRGYWAFYRKNYSRDDRRTAEMPIITTYIPKPAVVTSFLLMNILYISA
jgi:hypothetical protein